MQYLSKLKMYLKNLSIINFRNHGQAELEFSEKVNCITGKNGAGKTNILEAIHYLSLTKSSNNPIDSQQINYEQNFFVVEGSFVKDEEEIAIFCGVKKNAKKQFKRNKVSYKKLAEHVGKFPLVLISPYDSNIILDGSEDRRKFLDGVLSQVDYNYLENLMAYNKVLKNRNALLKNKNPDKDVLQIFDDQLVELGKLIFKRRTSFMEEFLPVFSEVYKVLSAENEEVSLEYSSQLIESDFASLLSKSLQKDLILERTTVGVHKDDLLFTIAEHPLKKFASQGQQKTYLHALKLAEFQYLKKHCNKTPLLLLDDVFDKLDNHRVSALMKLVSGEEFGQIFVTDTDRKKLTEVFKSIDEKMKLFEVEQGEVKEVINEKR
jgi:DNA replication and repair protein RecF